MIYRELTAHQSAWRISQDRNSDVYLSPIIDQATKKLLHAVLNLHFFLSQLEYITCACTCKKIQIFAVYYVFSFSFYSAQI